MRRWIWFAIVVVLAIAGFVLFGDLSQLAERLESFHSVAFAAAAGLSLLNYAIRWLRWELYLRDRSIVIPRRASALVFGAGLSMALTPGKLGELVKSYLMRELFDVAAATTSAIVLAERVTDLLALVVLATFGAALFGGSLTLVVVASATLAIGLVLLGWPRLARWLIRVMTGLRWTRRARQPLLDVHANLATICRPRMLIVATAIAIPAWGCECVGLALVVRGLPGCDLALGSAMTIYASSTIAGALSFIPGGLGITEGTMAVWLAKSGLPEQSALAATLLVRLATLWLGFALGVALLAIARRRIRHRQSPAPDH